MPTASREDLESSAQAFFQGLAQEVAMERLGVLDDYRSEGLLRTSDDRIYELDHQLMANEFDRVVEGHAQQICRAAGTRLEDLGPEQKRFVLALAARAERAKFAQLIHQLTTPGVTFRSTDELFVHWVEASGGYGVPTFQPKPSGISIHDAAIKFDKKVRNRGVGTSQITETARVLRWLAEAFGGDTPLAGVTTDDLRSFRDAIENLAAVRGKGITFAAHAAKRQEERIKSVTAIRYWSSVQRFFAWATEERLIATDPAAGLRIDKRRNEERASPDPFTSDELRALFQTPLYRGRKSRTRRKEPGDVRIRCGYWWSMILLLYTGMRAGEATQLLASDFRFDGPLPHIKLRETDDGGRKVKSLKTKASIRDVPIHPDLLTLGLRQFVDRRGRAYPGRNVLVELRYGADGRKSDGMTKFWGDYLRRFDLWKPGRAAHVARHTLTAFLRAAMVAEEDIGAIVGHAARSITATYGGAYPLERKARCLEKLDFGFDVVGVLGGPYDDKYHRA